MIRFELMMSFCSICVSTVTSTQTVGGITQPQDRRALLRRQQWYPEENERYARSTPDDDAGELVEEDYYGGADAPILKAVAHERGKVVSRAAPERREGKGRIENQDDGKAALYEAREEDTATDKKLSTDTEARFEAMQERIDELEAKMGSFTEATKGDASRIPTTMDEHWNFHERSLTDRVRYLERKVDGAANWLTDPQLYEKLQLTCKNMTNLGTDHRVCLDNFAQHGDKKCVVYDLGIRANPEFGAAMMDNYGCSIRAYDPSPMSKKWWAGQAPGDKKQKALLAKLKQAGPDKYDFHNVGAGGNDGPFSLFEYNWNQVSIFHAENDHTPSYRQHGAPDLPPKKFDLQALTLPTMMRNNKDTYIDVLKLDIEGSEYMFMQDMFDRMGCPPVGQIALEWHAFSNDPRYGSPPEINTLHNLMTSCGYKMFFNHEHWRAPAGVATDENGHESHSNRQLPSMRYALASYCKDCVPTENVADSIIREGANVNQEPVEKTREEAVQ